MLFYERKGNALIARLSGELDHSAATRLRAELDGLIDETGVTRLLLDMSALDFMDSSGIGLVIGRYKRLSKRGGSVAVIGTNARIDRIFNMAGLYSLVERLA